MSVGNRAGDTPAENTRMPRGAAIYIWQSIKRELNLRIICKGVMPIGPKREIKLL